LKRMCTAAGVFGLLVGGAATAPQTPTAPQAPNRPQAPTVPQTPTAPQAPTLPQAPTAPQRPSAPQAPTAPQAPIAAPGGAYPPQPYAPIGGAFTPTPMVRVQSPGSFNRTNLATSGRQFGSNLLGGIPSPDNSVTTLPRALAIGGAQPAGTWSRYGLRCLWMLYFAGLFGVGFYFIRKTLIDGGARPDTKADGGQLP
jgi:hypothetical protein